MFFKIEIVFYVLHVSCFFQWSLELQDQEKVFLQQSNQVNAWDRMLADSGEKVSNYITPDRLWCGIYLVYLLLILSIL